MTGCIVADEVGCCLVSDFVGAFGLDAQRHCYCQLNSRKDEPIEQAAPMLVAISTAIL